MKERPCIEECQTEPTTFMPNSWHSEQSEPANLKATINAGDRAGKSNLTSMNSSLSRKFVTIKGRGKCATDSSATSTNYFGNENSCFTRFDDSSALPAIAESEVQTPTLRSDNSAVRQKIGECSNFPNFDGNRKRARVGCDQTPATARKSVLKMGRQSPKVKTHTLKSSCG
jgi:hypothetical protein